MYFTIFFMIYKCLVDYKCSNFRFEMNDIAISYKLWTNKKSIHTRKLTDIEERDKIRLISSNGDGENCEAVLMAWNSWKSTFLLSTRWGWQRLLACCHDGRSKRNLLNINYHPKATTLSSRPSTSFHSSSTLYCRVVKVRVNNGKFRAFEYDTTNNSIRSCGHSLSFFTGQFNPFDSFDFHKGLKRKRFSFR